MFRLFKQYLALGMVFCISLPTYAQKENSTMSLKALADSMKQSPKPMMILISTDWCKYCQLQKAQLLKSKVFVDAKNAVYYCEINAETKEDILFNGQVYKYSNSGSKRGIHELVIALADRKEQITYPLWIILDQNYNILLRRNGLLEAYEIKEIVKVLSYN